MGHLHQRKTAT